MCEELCNNFEFGTACESCGRSICWDAVEGSVSDPDDALWPAVDVEGDLLCSGCADVREAEDISGLYLMAYDPLEEGELC